MSQLPSLNHASIIRSEFTNALATSLKRAAIFEKGEDHANFVMDLAVKTSFYIATEKTNVQELFEDKIANNPESLKILDLLHEFMVTFQLGLLLHDPALPDSVMNIVVRALTVNNPDNNSATVLPAHVTEAFAKNLDVKHVLVGNSWFYALALIRLFGSSMMLEDTVAPKGRSS